MTGRSSSFERRHGQGLNYYELYRQIALPLERTAKLFGSRATAASRSSARRSTSAPCAAAEQLECPAYKIASFEICDDPLLRAVAGDRRAGHRVDGRCKLKTSRKHCAFCVRPVRVDVALLHCVSEYPAKRRHEPARARLALVTGRPVGLSDHTLDNLAATVAVARGAVIIEKHFTLRRSDGGPDAGFSLEPIEFTGLVSAVREAWETLGDADVLHAGAGPGAEHAALAFRRAGRLRRASALTAEHVRAIRPGLGLPPRKLPEVLGRRARRDLARGEPLQWEDLA